MKNLVQVLTDYGESDFYPYHMPGHKRMPMTSVLEKIGKLDITEIDGFDNLHGATGILKDIQDSAARLYGAEESYFLVNGSTAGILSAVSTVLPRGGKLLMVRHCHKAAYHVAYLRELEICYLLADMDEVFDIHKEITAKQVEKAISANSDIGAVLIVSPTYEGVVSNIAEIAKITHKFGIPLIVDEAHGAHLGFHEAWPLSSCVQGVDIVIQSLHKTLPSPTQTALLHVNGTLVDRNKLRRFLSIYQSSSPSYILMAAMEESLSLMEQSGKELFKQFMLYWNEMICELKKCKHIKVFPSKTQTELASSKNDIGKLVISVKNTNITGQQLYQILLDKYHLQMEMSAGTYVLAMFTVADKEEGYKRLTQAILTIDEELKRNEVEKSNQCNPLPLKQMEIFEAWDKSREEVLLEESVGNVVGDYIYLYPPGAPIIVPGEVMSKEVKERVIDYVQKELPIQGIICREKKIYITIIKG